MTVDTKGMAMERDLAQDLARFGSQLRFDHLPADVVAAVRWDLLDTMGCAFGGARAPGIAELAGLLREWGGRPESAAWSWGFGLPAPAAALLNGTMAHALDYDDTHDAAVLHAGAVIIPAAVAAAGRSAALSGADLLTAITAGIEVTCRLGAAVTEAPGVTGWLLTPLSGYFGAAVAAARVLGLDEHQTRHALGIAYAQASGNGQATIDGALTKRMQAGLAARGGLFAAVLASRGFTGALDVFEGRRGYFRVYHRGAFNRQEVLDGLGHRFMASELSFKPYPCCRGTHGAIEAALHLRNQGLIAEQVERVEVGVNQQVFNSTCDPLPRKQRPVEVVDAQFSIPYAFAVALLTGNVGLADFEGTAIDRPEVLALSSRVFPFVSAEADMQNGRSVSGAWVRAVDHQGGEWATRVDDPPGSQHRPLPPDRLLAKFHDCCAYGGLSASTATARADAILGIDSCPDVRSVLSSWEER